LVVQKVSYQICLFSTSYFTLKKNSLSATEKKKIRTPAEP
jgi:hypothetical protein